jgi:5-methylthioadenosine/S-adenosylhomocysteine deaminase
MTYQSKILSSDSHSQWNNLVDILIKNGIIVTMDPNRRVIADGAAAVEKDRITDLGPSPELERSYDADREIDARGMVVLPGLMDGHGHAGHSLLRSLGQHNDTWYKACEAIYAEASTEEFWRVDALLTYLERLSFGTTCGVTFLGGGDSVMRVDDPVFAKRHCEAAEKVGVRTFLAVGPRRPPYPSKFSIWSGDNRRDRSVSFEEQVKTCEKIIEQNNGVAEGRVKVAVMLPTPHPENKPIVGAELEDLKQQSSIVRGISRKEDLMFTMDGHSRGTVEFCHRELDLLGPEALFSHSTNLTDEEIRLLSETGTKVTHNPSAIASMLGRCPVPELLDAGVTVVLGSDAGAPDRSYDMFRHMFQCMRYHRRHFRDPRVLPPGKVLEMATIDGAKAFREEADLGSLEVGKKADIILVNMKKPHLHPLNMPVDRLTYYANGNDVDTVIVDGRILMMGREIKTLDMYNVLEQADQEIEAAVGRSGLKDLYATTDRYWGHSRY